MTQVRFYRGSQEVSLPEIQPGAIFIMQRDDTHGDMFVDTDENTRLHITPGDPVEIISIQDRATTNTLTSKKGQIYYFEDNNKPYLKIGDGSSTIGNLLSWTTVTAEQIDFWTNNALEIKAESLGNNQYNIKFSKATM